MQTVQDTIPPDIARARAKRCLDAAKAAERSRAADRRWARRSYRAANPLVGKAAWEKAAHSLKYIRAVGHDRLIFALGGRVVHGCCFTRAELAAAMGRSEMILHFWIRYGQFPQATHEAMGPARRRVGVYTERQVRGFLTAYIRHARDVCDHYRSEHEDLRMRFFAAAAPRPEDFRG